MKKYNRITDGPLEKGQLFINSAGWPGIVRTKERTKKYHPTVRIECAEIYGLVHECGSCYANEVTFLLNEEEFEREKAYMGYAGEENFYKGNLIGY